MEGRSWFPHRRDRCLYLISETVSNVGLGEVIGIRRPSRATRPVQGTVVSSAIPAVASWQPGTVTRSERVVSGDMTRHVGGRQIIPPCPVLGLSASDKPYL